MEREPLVKNEPDSNANDEEITAMADGLAARGRSQLYIQLERLDRWTVQAQMWYKEQNMRSRSFITASAVGALMLILYVIFHAAGKSSMRSSTIASHEGIFAPLYMSGEASPGIYPLDIQQGTPNDICQICNCESAPAYFQPSSNYSYLPGRPSYEHIWVTEDQVDVNEFMRQTLLDMYCARQHLSTEQALKLLRRALTNMPDMMSWSLGDLKLGMPTVYMTTATSPNSKSGPLRPQYFRRHGRTIRSWIAQQQEAAGKLGFQVVWIVAEDEADIDQTVSRTLRRTGVPYVYFSYGLTKAWGNAQKNAVLQVAYALSRPHPRGLLGNGPVYGLDDDNKILPGLVSMLTKLVRVGVFPVGNLGGGWEKPILDDQGIVTGTDSPWQRKFPLDYGGYSFNTSLLGTIISGPSFWKHTGYGGEDQFVEQFASSMRDMEPLCGKSKDQDCKLVWHNEELSDIEKMTDEEEIAYVQKYGAERLYKQLGLYISKSNS